MFNNQILDYFDHFTLHFKQRRKSTLYFIYTQNNFTKLI